MKSILNRFKQGTEWVGVEIYLLAQEHMAVRYVKIKQQQGHAVFGKGEYHLERLEQLKEAIHASIPILLSINGQGIIHRSFKLTDGEDTQDYVRQTLPNITPDRLYTQENRLGDRLFVSLTRKDTIDDIQAKIQALGLTLFSVTLGPMGLLPLLSYMEVPKTGILHVDGHQLSFEQGQLVHYKLLPPKSTEAKKIEFAGADINECLVTAYATALCYSANILFPQITLKDIAFNRKEYYYQRRFKKTLTGVSAAFLFILLLNTFLYYHYASDTLSYQSERLNTLRKEEKTLSGKLKDQMAIDSITMGGTASRNHPMSHVADLLAANLPASITLNEMLIYPLDKKLSQQERRPFYHFDQVYIKGVCKSGKELSAWLEAIRQTDFCQRVELSDYESLTIDAAAFTITLSLFQR